jgi:lysyl-tRNA synthetase class 2
VADRGEELLRNRAEKLDRLRRLGIDPYPARYRRTHTMTDALRALRAAERSGQEPARVSIAGRIASVRRMGKAAFLDLQDGTGRMQAHLRRDILGDDYDLLKSLDLADHLGVEGPLLRTNSGEATVEAHRITLLSKALRPPPEKRHGLRDVEQRLRQREVDLLSNDDVRARFVLRSRLVEKIRKFLGGRGFIEVETPVLVPVAAGAMAQPFVTHHNALSRTLYLRIATELYLKRCIIGGLDKVFEIGRVFRNEGLDAYHNPEYTLLESYEAYADYQETMEMVEIMVSGAARSLHHTTRVPWNGAVIDFRAPWRRLNLREALLERSGIDIEEYANVSSLAPRMHALGIEVTQEVSWGRLVDKLLSNTVEPTLIQPTFLVDYPVEMSPLAKRKQDDPRYVERFEAFAGGMELANAFSELNDPQEQRLRFTEQEGLRKQHGNEDFDRLDEAFLLAMEHGMPPTGGLGMGIDRLAMLFSGQSTIREVVLFPHLSLSQDEVFREADKHIALHRAALGIETEHTGEQDLSRLAELVWNDLADEIRERITREEIRSRVEAYNG